VEEAEGRKSPAQRLADRFTAYYLPVVLLVAVAALVLTGRPENAVSVLLVACACAIVLATPLVVMASVGACARRGVLVKGGAALEQLARIDTVVFDKTGTLTRGKPRVTAVESVSKLPVSLLLQSAAALERQSEHPLGQAILAAAREQGLQYPEVHDFTCHPGRGVTGSLQHAGWAVGNRRLLSQNDIVLDAAVEERARALEAAGNTVFFIARERQVMGLVALADEIRPEAADAIAALREAGIRNFLILTGDSELAAAPVARTLGLNFQAALLPEDKLTVVRDLQGQGHRVMVVGDGINDAPALAQADLGVAMGGGGTAVAIEAASVALMRDDLRLLADAIVTGRRAVRTIRQNLGFTVAYNTVGLSLAALGVLPPVWAAAAHNLPDLLIMANSSRLLRERHAGLSQFAAPQSTHGACHSGSAIHRAEPGPHPGHDHCHCCATGH